jgi:hypothetical protein
MNLALVVASHSIALSMAQFLAHASFTASPKIYGNNLKTISVNAKAGI